MNNDRWKTTSSQFFLARRQLLLNYFFLVVLFLLRVQTSLLIAKSLTESSLHSSAHRHQVLVHFSVSSSCEPLCHSSRLPPSTNHKKKPGVISTKLGCTVSRCDRRKEEEEPVLIRSCFKYSPAARSQLFLPVLSLVVGVLLGRIL